MPLDRFAIQQIKFNAGTASFSGVQGQAADYGQALISRQSDGILQPTSRSISRLAPRASFSTLAVDTWITALNGNALWPMKALDASNGLVLVGAKAATSDAAYAAGSVHEALTALRGIVFANSFAWGGPDSDLVASLSALFISSDGDAAALVPSAVALPAQPIPVGGFDLTSLTIGGTGVDGVSNLSISGDPKMAQRWNHNKVYPQQIHGAGLNSPLDVSMSFGVEDMTLARSIGALGSTGQVVATFQRYALNSATRGSVTITFTLNNCLIRLANPHDGRQGSPVSAALEVLPTADDDQPMFTAVVS